MSKQDWSRTDDPWLPYLLRLERLAWRLWLMTVAFCTLCFFVLLGVLYSWWWWVFYPLLARR